MRLAMLSYHTNPLAVLGGKHTGGMNVYVRELSRHLGLLGYQVDVFTRVDPATPEGISVINSKARVIALPVGPSAVLDKEHLADYVPEFASAIERFAHEDKLQYGLIHAHYWMSGLAGVQLKRAWGIPLVFMFHTLGLMKAHIEQLGLQESERRIRGERQALRHTNKVVAATPAESAQLQWLYEVRTPQITVIPPGVDLDLFRPIPRLAAREALGFAQGQHIVLYVGRIEPLKGIDMLIQASEYLLKNRIVAAESFSVVVVGGDVGLNAPPEDLEIQRLQKLVERAGLSAHIRFLGARPQTELPAYYSAADVVVVPSYYESFGMVALEAMACGRPVIASRVGGLAYLVQDGLTGFQVPEGYPLAMAERLETLLMDEELSARLGKAGRAEALKYSWSRVAREISEQYQSLASL